MLTSSAGISARPALGFAIVVLLLVSAGIAAAVMPPLVFVLCGLAFVVVAIRYVEPLALAIFWTLPYMIVNLPTGVFTLKLPEVIAYIFGAATVLRSLLRRERLVMPPATWAVLLFLGVCALSTACRLPAAIPFESATRPTDRNSSDLRSISEVLWLGISWLVVVGLYNVAGGKPAMYRRCVVAHCLGGGLASAVSMVIYVLTLGGLRLSDLGGAGLVRNLAPQAGSIFRLAGVSYEPLTLGFYLLTVIPVTLVVYFRYPEWVSRKLSGAALLMQVLAMILTFSSGGIVSLIGTLILLIPVLRTLDVPRKILRRFAIGGSILAVLGTVAAVVVNGLLSTFMLIFTKVDSDQVRAAELHAGFAVFQRFPWLGCGPAMSGFYFPKYNPNVQSMGALAGDVNNIIIGTLSETGILGLITLTLCVLAGMGAILTVVRRYTMARTPILCAMTASLIGTAVQAQSMGTITLSFIYFTGIVGLALVGVRAADVSNGAAESPAIGT